MKYYLKWEVNSNPIFVESDSRLFPSFDTAFLKIKELEKTNTPYTFFKLKETPLTEEQTLKLKSYKVLKEMN